MDENDKLDAILKKLKETENKVKELEKKNEDQEKALKHEEAAVERFTGKQQTFFGKNRLMILAAIIIIAAVLIILFAMGLPPFSFKSAVANTSAQFFSASDGSLLGSNYITGLSNLSSQLSVIGGTQVNANLSSSLVSSLVQQGFTRVGNSSVFCLPASAGSSSSQSHPAYCLMFMTDGNYNVIPIAVNGSFPTLTSGGKSTFLYMGASGCPYCAAMRWSIAVALSRFGSFSKLFSDRSATIDGNVPTIMFNFSISAYDSAISLPPVKGGPYGDSNPTPFASGAYYSSQYVNFEPHDQLGTSFITNSTGIENLVSTNFAVPASQGFNISEMPDFPAYGVPFFDINNQYVFDGAIVNIAPLFSSSTGSLSSQYSTHADILNSIQNPSQGSFGETVLGGANVLTALICETINNTAPVCSLSYIQGIQTLLNKS